MRRLVALAAMVAALIGAGPAHAGLLDRINAEREAHDRPALVLNKGLCRPADVHAQWVKEHGLIHDTSYITAALDDYAPGWELGGENLAGGPTARAIVAAWMDSKTHRRNLLRSRFDKVGLGIYRIDGEVWAVAWFYDS